MREKWPFYIWLIPLIWAAGTIAQHRFPGDENAFYLISAIPACWIAPVVLVAHIPAEGIPNWVIPAGLAVMVLVGWGLDRLRVPRLLWTVLFLVFSVTVYHVVVASYPNAERAIGANGSLWAYGFLGVNVGLYLSVIVSAVATGVSRAAGFLLRVCEAPADKGACNGVQ
ncbi:MAG: hypothetical protein ABFE01_07035 [Phycisphaerales bacterium]